MLSGGSSDNTVSGLVQNGIAFIVHTSTSTQATISIVVPGASIASVTTVSFTMYCLITNTIA